VVPSGQVVGEAEQVGERAHHKVLDLLAVPHELQVLMQRLRVLVRDGRRDDGARDSRRRVLCRVLAPHQVVAPPAPDLEAQAEDVTGDPGVKVEEVADVQERQLHLHERRFPRQQRVRGGALPRLPVEVPETLRALEYRGLRDERRSRVEGAGPALQEVIEPEALEGDVAVDQPDVAGERRLSGVGSPLHPAEQRCESVLIVEFGSCEPVGVLDHQQPCLHTRRVPA